MDITSLHNSLLEAYTIKNLNKISLTLIELYKNEQYEILQKMADIISDFVTIEIGEKGKGFSRFMMLYHPDRSDIHLNEINRLANDGDFDGLLEYSHILKLERIDEIASSLNSYEDIDYSPVYSWDVDTEGFRVMTDREKNRETVPSKKRKKRFFTFYDAVKIRYYGNTRMEYPSYYLEDIDEFELSASDINDLDGIQFCIHTKIFDLSDNHIFDLTPLSGLTAIEELNLADNDIQDIDSIAFLSNLQSLILSNNKITDISPLFDLDKLEYVDLSGNKIIQRQIEKLREAGITVIFQ